MVVNRVALFQDKRLNLLLLCMYTCAVVKVDVMSIEENDFIFDRGGTTYIVE